MNRTRTESPVAKRALDARTALGKIYAEQAKPFPSFIFTLGQVASFTPAPLVDEMDAIARDEAIAKRTKDI